MAGLSITNDDNGGAWAPTSAAETVKKTAVTDLIPNPMHQFPSWTYTWSLWWLDADDFNLLADCEDVDRAMTWHPRGPGTSGKSFILAEDSGVGVSRDPAQSYRFPKDQFGSLPPEVQNLILPAVIGLNYNIQDVQLSTTFGLNKTTETSNLLSGSLTVVEPYGVTFIDTLVGASYDPSTRSFKNYTQQPMMLQLDFHGYNNRGEMLPESAVAKYRKRFPITLLAVKVDVSNKGSEYKITFAPAGHEAHKEENAKTPKHFTIVAGTVKEFFTDFQKQYNEYYRKEVQRANASFGDSIKFDIDAAIFKSSIVNPDETSLAKANPNTKDVTLTKNSWAIPAGTSIIKVINKVIAHSDWLINEQLGYEKPKPDADQVTVTNLIKVVAQTKYQGINSSGDPVPTTQIDPLRNSRAKEFTYKVHQFATWKASHPAMASLPDSIPHTIKAYNYIYTGQNTDIVDLKLQFDTTYYTSIMSYNKQLAATQTTAQTGGDLTLSLAPSLNLIPSALAAGIPGLAQVPNITPYRVKNIVNDPNSTVGLNTSTRPGAVVGTDVIKSSFSDLNGDMLKVDLTIVGDPTLLKQDDWAYVPSPTKSSIFNSWDSLSQSDFAYNYGHVRTDAGELIVTLTINTPIDIDTEYNNTGLVTPLPWSRQSLFSGQYSILKVDSKFVSGKFEQVLHLARYINSSMTTAAAEKNNTGRVQMINPATGKQVKVGDTVATVQTNQSESNTTNSSTTNEGYDGENGVNYQR